MPFPINGNAKANGVPFEFSERPELNPPRATLNPEDSTASKRAAYVRRMASRIGGWPSCTTEQAPGCCDRSAPGPPQRPSDRETGRQAGRLAVLWSSIRTALDPSSGKIPAGVGVLPDVPQNIRQLEGQAAVHRQAKGPRAGEPPNVKAAKTHAAGHVVTIVGQFSERLERAGFQVVRTTSITAKR